MAQGNCFRGLVRPLAALVDNPQAISRLHSLPAARATWMAKATYKDSGVDLDVYRQAMARLPRLLHRTYSPRVIPFDGGFAGLFQLDFTSQLFARHYSEPVLVSCTDGVGTKLKVAAIDRQPPNRRHRSGGDERQRRHLLRRRAAFFPGLRGHVA